VSTMRMSMAMDDLLVAAANRTEQCRGVSQQATAAKAAAAARCARLPSGNCAHHQQIGTFDAAFLNPGTVGISRCR
jgi:membrane protease subunit (stomatin/prohibitin family)